MVIIVTGTTGIGKTTVCQRLIEIIRNTGYTCGGILTYKAEDKGIIIEDIQSGEKETLASINDVYHGPRTAKYFFKPEGIDIGIRAIDKGISATILIVDEIGHLELRGEGFVKISELIKAGKVKNCLLVIRKELLPAFLPRLPTKPLVFETTINNRNQLPQKIGSVLFGNLQ
ncbi:nucleoside-triphosphatase [Chloroflexota bacterium]